MPPHTTLTEYLIRPATVDDIPHLVDHRAQMFRDMLIDAHFDNMSAAMAEWLQHAIPSGTYRAWVAAAPDGAVVAGGGLIIIPWPPGPMSMDPRCGFIFNIYTDPAHRKQGLAKRLVNTMHDHCRAEGVQRVVLNASIAGLPIYASMGYVVTDQPMMRLSL